MYVMNDEAVDEEPISSIVRRLAPWGVRRNGLAKGALCAANVVEPTNHSAMQQLIRVRASQM